MTDSNKTTRLSLITNTEARLKQAERNDELMTSDQPIEGEGLWTEKDYRLQMEHCKSQAEQARQDARLVQDRMSMRWNEPEGLPGDSG